MTDAEVEAAAAELVERSRREQRLPPTITDPSTLARVGAILASVAGLDRRVAS